MEPLSVASLMVLASLSTTPQKRPLMTEKPVQVAVTCFKTGEETDGLNKICYYNCLGSRAAITIGATQICPLNIER